MSARGTGRLEGRLFAEAGHLCLVVEADEGTGIGRVSCQIDGKRAVVERPVAELRRCLTLGANLVLDNLSDTELQNSSA